MTEKTNGTTTVRCPFCLTLNRVEVARAGSRPKCGSCERPLLLDRPIKVEEEDFQRTVLESGAPVLVDFYADWCQPCRMLAPMIDQIAGAEQGRLVVAKVDTDRAPDVAQRYGIRSIPTVIVFKDGEELGRSVGIMPDELKALVGQAVA
ncbi:MAG: thioredoxin [Gemmatimonadota bacterium]|nr:thioredoxin [Gemmatimonadota bacterium]